MAEKATEAIEFTQQILIFLLSWVVLTAAAIIISGKLMSRRILLGFADDDLFKINLIIFKLKAQGDEVSLGLIVFILNLFGFIMVGAPNVHAFIKTNAGVDIGQWNSLCAAASFTSIAISFLLFLIFGMAKGVPILADSSRSDMLKRVKTVRGIRDDD